MGVGTGFGKSILFGEHFVVYGFPSLVVGIDSKTITKVSRTPTPEWTLDDKRPAVLGYKEKKRDEHKASIEIVLEHLGIDISEEGIHIEQEGDLICASGFGSSAASCVSLARALNSLFELGLDDANINEAAYEGEKGSHGTPSGVDNTASTYGGLIWYSRKPDGSSPTVKPIELDGTINLVIASSGLTASTTEVVGDVLAKKEANPDWFDKIASEYRSLVDDALTALKELDLEKVGELMNKNHELLQELTVSCRELDDLVKIAKEDGALGAKLTGTGRGGNIIAIAPDESTRDKIAESLKNAGTAFVIPTTFGN